MKSTANGYGSVAVTIHWLTAGLVAILIVTGFRAGFSTEAAAKVAALRIHLPVAVAVLLLTLVRLVWWWRFDRKPPLAEGVPDWQGATARWAHRLLYLLLLGLLASLIAMSVLGGLPDALFGTAPLPELSELPPRTGHGLAARLLVAVLLLHAGAALLHHIVLKDATLRRMWFARR
jgi:cytochrome b561